MVYKNGEKGLFFLSRFLGNVKNQIKKLIFWWDFRNNGKVVSFENELEWVIYLKRLKIL
jgi:hypothetical protein